MNQDEDTETNSMRTMQEKSTESTSEAGAIRPARKRNKVAVTAGVLTIALVIIGAWWWLYAHGREETDDAYVEGHITYISSRVSGNVTNVLVDEHQRVKTGQLLVQLDDKDQQAKLDEDEASLAQAQHQASAAKSKIQQSSLSALGETAQANGDINAVQAEITTAKAAVLQAGDQVRQSRARLKELVAQEEFARTDFQRYKTVYESRAVTKQQYDKAQQTLHMQIAQREQAEESLRQSQKQVLQAQSKVEEAIGRLQKSRGMFTSAQAMVSQQRVDEDQYRSSLSGISRYQAALSQAKLQLSYTKILAPVDGRVGKKSVEVGQRVDPGQTLLSVVQDEFWIMANYKETQVGRMRVGQEAEIKIDTFPGHTFKGKVESLSPASGAKFSMLPAENASGNFTKIVQRIPVKIVFDEQSLGDYRSKIGPGMSCLVTVLVNK
jgi:membrane fusion protein, multidrug efflux system